MPHPPQFDPADPVLARLRKVCLALPGAGEKVSHGRPAFFTKKVFAIFGAVVKGDTKSDRYRQSLLFLPADDDRAALTQDDRFFEPAYWGPYGWMGIDLNPDQSPKVDWGEVSELVEDSFRATATKKLITELDAGK